MNAFSLRTIIDDILLIVRNNNISESEDLSRDQIASWIIQYKHLLAKKERDRKEKEDDDKGEDDDDSLYTTTTTLHMVEDRSDKFPYSECYTKKKSSEKLPKLMGDSSKNVNVVTDEYGNIIQIMDDVRVKFHRHRRYTYKEPVCWYDDGYIYVEGGDIDDIKTVYVEANVADDPDADSEDDVIIPDWMASDIKRLIFENELKIMLGLPSDDDNNSTLQGIKPHGPQDQEK